MRSAPLGVRVERRNCASFSSGLESSSTSVQPSPPGRRHCERNRKKNRVREKIRGRSEIMSTHDDWETKLEIRACSFEASPAGGDKHPDCSSPQHSIGKSETSTEIFGSDPLRTLGEILAYCQVMYEAIQKLDEKFELLQARVTHIQEDQIHIEDDQSEIFTLDDPETVQINDDSAETTYHVLHHQGSLSVPPSPEGSRTLKLVISSETPTCSSASPQSQTQQSTSASTPRRAVKEMLFQQRNVPEDLPDTDAGRSVSRQTTRKVLHQQRKIPDPQRRSSNAGSRKFVIPSSVLTTAGAMARPTAAARYLMRSLFSRQELLHGSIRGHAARGLKKLNPDKISAIREWAQVTYPEHDLQGKGKDWKACLAVMNEGARHVRLKDKKRKGKTARHTSDRATSGHEFKPVPTAEIDVELSDGESDDLRRTSAFKHKPKQESDVELLLLESDYEPEAQGYLGQPDREVKVPQLALYSASQRPNPALAARHLIRFMFPEEVLVQSNVYGNAKYGILPLDHNKISALREYLCDRFPYMKLDEDGPNWKACVYAINGAIRKTRHTLKKCHRQAQDETPMTS